MTGKPELILRPSTRYPSRPWALQLRVAGPAETSYAPIGHVSDNVACILADEGYACFLFGDPREERTCRRRSAVSALCHPAPIRRILSALEGGDDG